MKRIITNVADELENLSDLVDDWCSLNREQAQLVHQMYFQIKRHQENNFKHSTPRRIIAETGLCIDKILKIENQIEFLMDTFMYDNNDNREVVEKYENGKCWLAYYEAREILLEDAPALAKKYDPITNERVLSYLK